MTELESEMAEFRTASAEQTGETIEFQAQLSELKGASAKQKAVIALNLSQTITVTCDNLQPFSCGGTLRVLISAVTDRR